ncbi:MAG: HAMP domain-containing histidine kinase, partial [Motiliproteus sp.]|nr:HAMP domain-containing histidine kinase [Motiliproteus sp.]
QLVSATETLLKIDVRDPEALKQSADIKDAVAVVLENEGPFLSGMSRIVFQYASESEERQQATNELENLLFVSGIILLILEGVFIFRPVIQRTVNAMALLRKSEQSLKQTRRRLEASISELREAQENLLDVEKKAVLASVVAGVTHDVNTPLGVCITAASTLRERNYELISLYHQGNVSRAKMEDYQAVAKESTEIVLNNLRKATELIRNFKQLAVDQSSEQRRRFNLRDYLDDIVLGLSSKLRTTEHQLRIECSEDIQLDSYPGALYQVISNLIMNSLIHGFSDQKSGSIYIEAKQVGDHLEMIYRDDGKGMDANTEKHCFDSFFTTRREQGGSGIGTHVIKTLVEETLAGSISLNTAPDKGVEFKISFPVVAHG